MTFTVSRVFGLISIAVLISMLSWPHIGAAQEAAENDHAAVIEAGAASEHSISGGSSSFGPTQGIEVTPIENWLELAWSSRSPSDYLRRPNSCSV
jgi:hypothetical protein